MRPTPKILLLGCDGQVGFELQRSLSVVGELQSLGRRSKDLLKADLSQIDELRTTVRHFAPDLIVNAAAFTAVDKAESEPNLAYQVNGVAPGILAEEAEKTGAWLVHYSTDYVFDGSGVNARDEQATPAPLSVYGRSKLQGEEAIRASKCNHLIFRTSWVHSGHGSNFVRSILKLAEERESLRVVSDQIGSPTSAALIADVTAHALLKARGDDGSLSGTYHLCASGHVDWNTFARFIVARAHEINNRSGSPLRLLPEAIEPIPSSDYPLPATRPLNSRLDCSKIKQTFGVTLPAWQDGALRTVQQLLSH